MTQANPSYHEHLAEIRARLVALDDAYQGQLAGGISAMRAALEAFDRHALEDQLFLLAAIDAQEAAATDARHNYDLALAGLGQVGQALGHPDVARPESPAILVDRWCAEIRALREAAARDGAGLPPEPYRDERGKAWRKGDE